MTNWELQPLQDGLTPDLVPARDAAYTAVASHVKTVQFSFLPQILWPNFGAAKKGMTSLIDIAYCVM